MTSKISTGPGKATQNPSASTPTAAQSPSVVQSPSTGKRRGSFHLLPVLALALGLVLTIRVGDVWLGLTVGVGTETLAQAAPADEPAAEPVADPTEPAVESASTEGTPPAEADVGEPAPAEPTPAAPIDFTDEEVEVLQQLAKRREELDLRARQLDEREAMVAAAEQRMEQKMVELRALQTVVEDLLKAQSEAEEEQLQSLVKIYQNMKPKDAAQVFEELDLDVLLQVVARMNERKLAPILGLVSPTRAKEVTYELVQRQTLPFSP